jgi:prepilin-type N-terminal cleavage/methylation domain-containing protein
MTNTLKSKKGVTLVELLAVIVILGIIAAIAVPAIGGLIDRQRENAANASHEVVMNQAKTYVLGEGLVENDDFSLEDMITGYLDENPYDTYTAANIMFRVGANSTVTIIGIVGITDAVPLEIDGVEVTLVDIPLYEALP